MKSPLQWHNNPGKKIKDFLIESLMTLQNVHGFVGLWVLQCPGDYMSIICFISLVLVSGVSQNNNISVHSPFQNPLDTYSKHLIKDQLRNKFMTFNKVVQHF